MNFGNVLVTGGAGFLGSQLIKKLLPQSEQIYVIDDLSAGQRESIPDSPKIIFYKESITNKELLAQLIPKVEWVFHLACRSLSKSVDDMEADFHVNLQGGICMLEQCRLHGHRLKKFIHASTASIYGNAATIPTPEPDYQILLPYAASKFAVEHYCQVYTHLYQLPITVLRFSNVYGPGQLASNPYCGVVAKFFDAVKSGQPMIIYGDGEQTRDFTFVDDVLDAILTAATNENSIGKVYNVGTGSQAKVNGLAELIKSITGVPDHPISYLPKRTVDTVRYRAVDPSAIRRDLSWSAQHSLPQGIAKTFRWLNKAQ